MSDKTTTYSGGISASSLLGVAFIVLKLCGIINWSWWWVLSPFWITSVVVLTILAAILLVPLVIVGVYMLAAGVITLFNKLSK